MEDNPKVKFYDIDMVAFENLQKSRSVSITMITYLVGNVKSNEALYTSSTVCSVVVVTSSYTLKACTRNTEPPRFSSLFNKC